MEIREKALGWLAQQGTYPSEPISTSRYHTAGELGQDVDSWWFEFEEDLSVEKSETCVHLLCEDQPDSNHFHHLVIPCSFIKAHRDELGIRDDNGKYCLIVSADENNRFQELRGSGKLDLSHFAMGPDDPDG